MHGCAIESVIEGGVSFLYPIELRDSISERVMQDQLTDALAADLERGLPAIDRADQIPAPHEIALRNVISDREDQQALDIPTVEHDVSLFHVLHAEK